MYLDPVMVSVVIDDPETMSITWMTPQGIIDQGLSLYQLAITSQCFTSVQPTSPLLFTIQPQEPPSQQATGLRK